MTHDPTRTAPTEAPGPDGNQPQGPAPAGNDPESLRQRLETAERERDQYMGLLKGKQAEFENYQKRQKRVQEDERRFANFDIVAALLPVLDDLIRATAEARKAGETGIVKGVSMVEASFLDVLKRFGVTRMEALGKPFDPNLHQALAQQPSAEYPPNTVVHIFADGYLMHDRVLRPAQVAVSVAPPAGDRGQGEKQS
jgi:molecular chaperone GrpE